MEEAGRGWGARALEWAYLLEPYALPANDLLFDRLGVVAGARLLDVACGSGLAAVTASRRGARVAGLDVGRPLSGLPVPGPRVVTSGLGTCLPCRSLMQASMSPPASTASGKEVRKPSPSCAGC